MYSIRVREMTKNDTHPIAEFGAIVGALAGEEIQAQIMSDSEQIAQASLTEVNAWLKKTIRSLDTLVDKPTHIRIIRQMGLTTRRQSPKLGKCSPVTKTRLPTCSP